MTLFNFKADKVNHLTRTSTITLTNSGQKVTITINHNMSDIPTKLIQIKKMLL